MSIRECSKPCYVNSTLIRINHFAVNRALIKSWEHSPDLIRNVFYFITVKTYVWNCSSCVSALIVLSFFFRRPTISSGLHLRDRILINTFCTNQRYPSCKCFWPAVLRFASFSLYCGRNMFRCLAIYFSRLAQPNKRFLLNQFILCPIRF